MLVQPYFACDFLLDTGLLSPSIATNRRRNVAPGLQKEAMTHYMNILLDVGSSRLGATGALSSSCLRLRLWLLGVGKDVLEHVRGLGVLGSDLGVETQIMFMSFLPKLEEWL